MSHLPFLRFVEQYDPNDTKVLSQPYAYVADTCHEVSLGADIDEIRSQALPEDQSKALVDLRDWIFRQPYCGVGPINPKIGWYVVVCGDEVRSYDGDEAEDTHSDILANGAEEPVPTACVTCRRACACSAVLETAVRDSMEIEPRAVATSLSTKTQPSLKSVHQTPDRPKTRKSPVKPQPSLTSLTQSICNVILRRRGRSIGNTATSPINSRIFNEKSNALTSNTSNSRSTNSSEDTANKLDMLQARRAPQSVRDAGWC